MWLDLFDHGGFDLALRPFRPAELRAIVRNALNPPKFFCSAASREKLGDKTCGIKRVYGPAK
jgi:DNA-binding response OmpR family regulator